MSATDTFIDTNVALYLLSDDAAKADRAEAALAAGATISIQVLNEFASVALRRLGMRHPEVREVLDTVRRVCRVVPVTEAVHDRGLAIAERYGFSVYDSMIVAAAIEAGCSVLLTEDLQHGQRIEELLLVRNPFNSSVS